MRKKKDIYEERKDETELLGETALFLKGHKLHSTMFNCSYNVFTMKSRLSLNPWALAVFLSPG